MDYKFWFNKKVIVTGHTGFKGGWLSLWLQQMGAKVVGVSLEAPTNPSIFQEACISKNMCSIIEDIRNLDNIKNIFNEYEPETVFHLAAQPLVRYSYENPVETYSTNVMGTLNILEAIRNTSSVKSVVIVTTDKCYENKEWHWGYREYEPMGGHDPYSSSKGCAELLVNSYRKSFFSENDNIGIATARAGNVIGGGDWAQDRLIPDIIHAYLNNEPVFIRNPNSIRPWQHVLEPLYGYLLLAFNLCNKPKEFSSAWNFGPHTNDAKPVSWILEQIKQLATKNFNWEVKHSEQDPHESNFLKLDIEKAKTQLNWLPKLNLTSALQHTLQWYESWDKKENMFNVTNKQILDYAKLQNFE